MDDPERTEEGTTYSYRASAVGAPRMFRLTGSALEWNAGRRSGEIGYGAISRVRLSYRPAGMQSQRFLAEIWSSEAPKLMVYSVSHKGMFEQVRQDREYGGFITGLHARLAGRSDVQFLTGLPFPMFWGGLVLFAGASLGLAGLTVRAIQSDANLAALLIGAFLVLFLWQAGNYFSRNRPGRYTPQALPRQLMPRGD